MENLKMWIIVILAAACLGMQILGMSKNGSDQQLIMAVYKRGWIDGANASTGRTNAGIRFGPEIAEDLFKADSLKVSEIIKQK